MSRPLRIAQVAPLFERVPPEGYGGTERIVSFLTEGLVRRGHAVTLFAAGGSHTRGRLVAPTRRALRLDPDPPDPLAAHLVQMAQVFERSRDFDVIHCHVGHIAFPFARVAGASTVHTQHGRLDLPSLYPMFRHFRELPLVSISHAQRQPFRHLGVTWAGTVYHGLPLDDYSFHRRRGGYLAFLGRISPEKRPDLAIAVARQVGMPLKVAAKVDPVDQEYYEREIAPLMHHPLVEFIGEIDDRAKPEFLGGARALLMPIDWPEPFGLVMIEALACGTPVIARRRGSVPEVLRHGRTGFVAETVEEMAEAVRRLDRIDRAECRRDVEARFTVERMTAGYEAIYGSLVTPARTA